MRVWERGNLAQANIVLPSRNINLHDPDYKISGKKQNRSCFLTLKNVANE